MRKNYLKICDTTLRDGQQSLLSTRMRTEEIVPLAELIDLIGFDSMEIWGGATFDASLRFLEEDPWDRLRLIKERVKRTKLVMLVRGQNVVGYRHYPDDVVDAFLKLVKKNGIDIVRVFDALNDLRNIETAIRCAKKYDLYVRGEISYSVSPVHTVELFIRLALQLKEMGADAISIKDMAGILTPEVAIELIPALKEKLGETLIYLHTHATGGTGPFTCLKAVELGVDGIDTAIAPLAGGSAQPAIQPLLHAFKAQNLKFPELNIEALREVSLKLEKILEGVRPDYKVFSIDAGILSHQIPGGMISNLISQLKEMRAENRLLEVLAEVPRVREELGYPPLVTPLSQIVGTQSVINILTGERYQTLTKEIKDYLRGLYGMAPGPVNSALKKKVVDEEGEIKVRPADLLEPGLPKAYELGGRYIMKEEDALTLALFPEQGLNLLKKRWEESINKQEDLYQKYLLNEDGVLVYPA